MATPPPRPLGDAAAALAFGGTLADIRRPGTVTALAVWNFLQGGFLLVAALIVLVAAVAAPDTRENVWVLAAATGLYGLIGGAYVATGVGLLGLRSWGRILQIVVACIGLLGFPCATIISVFILVYMMKPGVRILFSGRTGELDPDEAAQVVDALRSRGAMWAVIALMGTMAVVFVVGIAAAVAIPALLRARVSANEVAAIGNLRTLVSAEATFASGHGGWYATSECLRQPDACVAGWDGKRLIPESIVFDAPASGYVLRFHPGPAATEGEAGASPFLIKSYAITAVPASVQGGVRRYCVEESGVVYVMPEGDGLTEAGRCPESSEPLR